MKPNRLIVLAVVLALLVLLLGKVVVGFYTEALWFSHVGFASVFWTRFGAFVTSKAAAAILTAAVVLFNLWIVTRHLGAVQVRRRYANLAISAQIPRKLANVGIFLISALAGWWLARVKFSQGMSIT